MGYLAILLGYFIPAVLTIAALITLISLHVGELTAGLVSIGILIPYYLVLYFFRDIVNSKFTFSIKS